VVLQEKSGRSGKKTDFNQVRLAVPAPKAPGTPNGSKPHFEEAGSSRRLGNLGGL
jgi:hypothetical protein